MQGQNTKQGLKAHE